MLTAHNIRQTFLDFFAKNGHEIVHSSPLVPLNDPTLLFTNAGMVPFKGALAGSEKRSYLRAASSQKCIRAGGKHNDLDNVGQTTRHHTFFEMLGNFSFGDYFKDLAIELAWNLIVKEYGISKDKILITVYAEDDEAFSLWKKISNLPDSKIIPIATSDNFWAMGDTGPCGPCSEIFYDHGDHIPGDPPGSSDKDNDRFIEIWNLVFMQFEQTTQKKRKNLPHPSIDTGMGLERITALLQGTHDNYETDLFRVLIEASADVTHSEPYGPYAISHRVIADHLRACSFLIADGVLPSNEGRGYVLRRIMRRAMRHVHMVGAVDPVMYRLVPVLVNKMSTAFPELNRAQALIEETLALEENKFKKLLKRGLQLLQNETKDFTENDGLSGEVAFKLYDTYGFPFDLTQDALKSRGIIVDETGFNRAMERQKTEARAAWTGSGDAATEQIWFEIRQELGASEFLGYKTETATAQVLALVVNNVRTHRASKGTKVIIIVNQTPFYGESGGQVGDNGIIVSENARVIVTDTQKKLGDLYLHFGKVETGTLQAGDNVKLSVDHDRRSSIRMNHSATHLLHAALRHALGNHVTQKGSLVAAKRLRFDISHPKAINAEEILRIEQWVNEKIQKNFDVTTHLMSAKEAIKQGAMALFGEKYGDTVRVVSMGLKNNDQMYSVELCGGIHVHRTGDIGLFKIISESAAASGIRRIEALTGKTAIAYLTEREKILEQVSTILRSHPLDAAKRVQALIKERKKMENQISDLRKKLAICGNNGNDAGAGFKNIAGITYAPRLMNGVPAKELKGMADEIKKQITSGVVALVTVNNGKASLVVSVTGDIKDKFNAVDLVHIGSAVMEGKGGGGRSDMAQAGGPNGMKAQAALDAIETALH